MWCFGASTTPSAAFRLRCSIWDLNVIFRNSEFCSVSGKEKQLFPLIFFKIHQFCSAELLVLAVSACDLLVSPNTEHPTTLGPSISSCCRVVWEFTAPWVASQEQPVVSQISKHIVLSMESARDIVTPFSRGKKKYLFSHSEGVFKLRNCYWAFIFRSVVFVRRWNVP